MSLVYRGLPLWVQSEADARTLLAGGPAAVPTLLRLLTAFDGGLGVWWTSEAGEVYSHAEATSGDYALSLRGSIERVDNGTDRFAGCEVPVVLTANAPTVWEQDDWEVAEGSPIDLVSIRYSAFSLDDNAWIEVPVGRTLTASVPMADRQGTVLGTYLDYILYHDTRFSHMHHIWAFPVEVAEPSWEDRPVGMLKWWSDIDTGVGVEPGMIEMVEVDVYHRRKGLATEMLRRAREIQPNVHHSTNLSPDGIGWSQRVGSVSDADQLRVEVGSNQHWESQGEGGYLLGRDGDYWYEYLGRAIAGWGRIAVLHKDQPVGSIEWSEDGEINMVWVHSRHRRRGIASKMLAHAREIDPSVHHSDTFTDAGRAWSQKVGSTSGLFWRVHPAGRPFGAEDATSTPFYDYPESKGTQEGYSCFANAWHLWVYTMRMGWGRVGTDVIGFSGTTTGEQGGDGEDLAVPDMRVVRRMSWEEFERTVLPGEPFPATPAFARWVRGFEWNFLDSWEGVARYLAEVGTDGPAEEEIIRRHPQVRTASRTRRGVPVATYQDYVLHHDRDPGEGQDIIWAYLASIPEEQWTHSLAVGSLHWHSEVGTIQGVNVDYEHRRKGLATAMLAEARRINPEVHRSVDLSPAGRAWMQAVGSLPSGIRFETTVMPDYLRERQPVGGTVYAFLDGGNPEELKYPYLKDCVGILRWYSSGEIDSVWVHPDLRRQGLATDLLRRAREADPTVHHSETLTPAGAAWSQRVGSRSIEVHRGVNVEVDFGNEYPEEAVRAGRLGEYVLRALRGQTGVHWTVSREIAEDFSDPMSRYAEPKRTRNANWSLSVPVVISATVDAAAIQTDGQVLDDLMVQNYGWQGLNPDRHEEEITLKPGAAVNVTSIRAALPTDPEALAADLEEMRETGHVPSTWVEIAGPRRVTAASGLTADGEAWSQRVGSLSRSADWHRGMQVMISAKDPRALSLLSALASGATNAARDRLIELMAGGTGYDPWTGNRNGPRTGAGGWWTSDTSAAWTYASGTPMMGEDDDAIFASVILHAEISDDIEYESDGRGYGWHHLEPGTPLTLVGITATLPNPAQARILLDLARSQGGWWDPMGMADMDTWINPGLSEPYEIEESMYEWPLTMRTEAASEQRRWAALHTAGPAANMVPLDRFPVLRADRFGARDVKVLRMVEKDLDRLEPGQRAKAEAAIDDLRAGRAMIEPKERPPLVGTYTVRVTNSLRLGLYLSEDQPGGDPHPDWVVYWVGDHNYQEAERRMQRNAAAFLPEDLRLRYVKSKPKFGGLFIIDVIEAWVGPEMVGFLEWFPDTSQIAEVRVEDGYRRNGIATKMLQAARQVCPDLKHSDILSPDGEAWMQAVGAHTASSASRLPDVGPMPDDYWGAGGCGALALAFTSLFPEMKIAVEWGTGHDEGLVWHAAAYHPTTKIGHDYSGTDDIQMLVGNFGGKVEMDVAPQRVADAMDVLRGWRADEPWLHPMTSEAVDAITEHWGLDEGFWATGSLERTASMDIRSYLEMVAKARGPKPEGWRYGSFEELGLDLGRTYTRIATDEEMAARGIEPATPQQCFANASLLAMDHPDLTYVEGWATGFFPTEHAWVVDSDGVVYDPTWNAAVRKAYFGVPMETRWLMQHSLRSGIHGVFNAINDVTGFNQAGADLLHGKEIIRTAARSRGMKYEDLWEANKPFFEIVGDKAMAIGGNWTSHATLAVGKMSYTEALDPMRFIDSLVVKARDSYWAREQGVETMYLIASGRGGPQDYGSNVYWVVGEMPIGGSAWRPSNVTVRGDYRNAVPNTRFLNAIAYTRGEAARKWIGENLAGVLVDESMFEDLAQTITVYRGISLSPDEDPLRSSKGDGWDLGSSWTTSLDAAKAIAERRMAGFTGAQTLGDTYSYDPTSRSRGEYVPTVLRAEVTLLPPEQGGPAPYRPWTIDYATEAEIDIPRGTEIILNGVLRATKTVRSRTEPDPEFGFYTETVTFSWPNPWQHANVRRTAGLEHTAMADLMWNQDVYYRTHDRMRSFSVSDATSVPLRGFHDPVEGYSAMGDPWSLWAYVTMQGWTKFTFNDDVLIFSGEEVGSGHDGEPLVIPDHRVERFITWRDFLWALARQASSAPGEVMWNANGYGTTSILEVAAAAYQEDPHDPVAQRLIADNADEYRRMMSYSEEEYEDWGEDIPLPPYSTVVTPRDLGMIFASRQKTAAHVDVEQPSSLRYDRYRVNERIAIKEGGGYHPEASIEAARAKQQASYERWRENNPGRRRQDRHKPENVANWVKAGYTYFTPENSTPGTVAFIDLEVRDSTVEIAFMAVRPDQRGRGLARQLVQETYDRHPGKKVHWGKMMQAEIGTLYRWFKDHHPEQTGSGSVYY